MSYAGMGLKFLFRPSREIVVGKQLLWKSLLYSFNGFYMVAIPADRAFKARFRDEKELRQHRLNFLRGCLSHPATRLRRLQGFSSDLSSFSVGVKSI